MLKQYYLKNITETIKWYIFYGFYKKLISIQIVSHLLSFLKIQTIFIFI